jgi:hypothetical protein
MKRWCFYDDQGKEEDADGEWVRWEDAYSWGSKKVESLIGERDALAVQVKTLQAEIRTLEAIRDVFRKHNERNAAALRDLRKAYGPAPK